MPPRFLFLDLNSYFASVEQQRKPDLRGEPVAVVPVMTDATCVIAASYEAKAFGITTGTHVDEAKKMCPGLKLVLANHEYYVEFHHRIQEVVNTVLPILWVASIDEFGCELTGTDRDESVAIEKAHMIKARLRERIGPYVRCSIGIAPNRYLAKVATNLQKPDGLVVIREADLPGRLMHLVPRDLPGIGHRMEARLAEQGITTFAHLWALAPKQMRAIWGSVGGEELYYRLRGVDIPLAPTHRSTVGHSHVLAPEWRRPELAHMVAQRLTLKAASRLRRMNLKAKTMDLSCWLDGKKGAGCAMKFPPACDNFQFLRALEAMWATMIREHRPREIKKISVTLHGLKEATELHPTLFDGIEAGNPQNPDRLAELSLAMDQLNAKFGRDTIVMGFLPRISHQFSGTKIAFSRVPEVQEFHE